MKEKQQYGISRIIRSFFLFASLMIVAGCATVDEFGDPNPDPFEPVNRATYKFNDAFDRYWVKPFAKFYRNHFPVFIKRGVSNFVINVGTPVVMVNDALQGKPKDATIDFSRFLANTVFGFGGIYDIAETVGLDKHEEDFGQTLGVWGIDKGAYLMLPFAGPSTSRDFFGLIADSYFSPVTYINDPLVQWGFLGMYGLDLRVKLLSADAIISAQFDPYVFIREAWLQKRESMQYDGNLPRRKRRRFPEE